MYAGLHHVALIVHDLEKAKQFYGEILGFTVSKDRPAFDFDGIWYHIGSTELHLVVPREPRAMLQKDGHFAFITDPEGHRIEFNEEQGAS